MTKRSVVFAQHSLHTPYFTHRDMAYYFAWIAGRAIFDGSDPDECLVVAARITDGDSESWTHEWFMLAKQVEVQAEIAVHEGRPQEAHAAYLRACSYYRAALFLMHPNDRAFHDRGQAMRWCFQQAAVFGDPRIERIVIPFHGTYLPGYLWKAAAHGVPQPTLIVIGGIETFAEDCYFMIGSAGAQRGYTVLTVDLPGQGSTPADGLFFEARMGPAVQAVLDYASTRTDIDQQRLALFGFSWGGHIVFHGVHEDQQHDQRIKTLIANPAMPDGFRAARAQQAQHRRGDRISRIVVDQIAWRMGLRISPHPRDILRRLTKAYDYFRFGKIDPRGIHCPTLCLLGESEAKITLEMARACVAQLPHPLKKLVMFTEAENGAAHCQINNLALPNRVMFDWLDTLFSQE